MTAQQFKRWQKRMKWSVSRAARELRVHERQIYCYRSGHSTMPSMAVRLCQVLEALQTETTLPRAKARVFESY